MAGASIGIKILGVNKTVSALKNYAKKAESQLYTNLVKALILVEAEAKRLIASGYYQPAITSGAMRSSVTSRVTQFDSKVIAGEVGTGVFYSFYVHDGTKYMQKRPFLTDALRSKRSEVRKLIRAAFTAKNQRFVTGTKIVR